VLKCKLVLINHGNFLSPILLIFLQSLNSVLLPMLLPLLMLKLLLSNFFLLLHQLVMLDLKLRLTSHSTFQLDLVLLVQILYALPFQPLGLLLNSGMVLGLVLLPSLLKLGLLLTHQFKLILLSPLLFLVSLVTVFVLRLMMLLTLWLKTLTTLLPSLGFQPHHGH